MKKFLFAVALFLGVLTLSAQQYDELGLLGTWKVNSQTGDISNTLRTFEKITFGETTFDKYYNNLGNWEFQESYPVPLGVVYNTTDKDGFRRPANEIRAFSIPNVNKLHILIVDKEELTMYFVIQRFTDEEMVLTNYTGSCELTLTKEGASKVNDFQSNAQKTTEYYSINGIKVENPAKGIFVEKKGNESHLITK